LSAETGNLVILSGEIESGKTTLLQMLLDQLSSNNLKIAGIVSPPIVKDGKKVGIAMQDLTTGKTQQLAESRNMGTDSTVITKHWVFAPEVIEAGNHILQEATPCDLLIVDELGPLEFVRDGGWVNGLAAVDSRQYALALCVVRPSLVELALKRWPFAQVFFATRETQSQILSTIKPLAIQSRSTAKFN